jgi:hypothetical protein
MGLFIAVAGIFDSKESEVINALSGYAKAKNGIFRAENLPQDDEDASVIYSANGHTSLLFPPNSLDWWDASQALSLLLRKVVIALHIHDGDLWMYELYKNGNKVDGFNPIPDYWVEEISDKERTEYSGNAETVAACIPNVKATDIEKYFVTWDLEADDEGKAYPTDEYSCGTDWQMLDFMKKIRLSYPLDEKGKPLGSIYRFVIPPPPKNK